MPDHVHLLLQDEDIERAEQHAPTGTRAYFRGACLEKFPTSIYGVSWTSVLVDSGNTTIKRIPLMDPMRGTRELTGELLEGVTTADQLLDRLSSV